MSFIDQPIYFNGMVKQVAMPPRKPVREVTIKRVSGPPVVVRPSSGISGRPESGLDERTVEALGMTMKSARTKYTESQYSEAHSSIIVGYSEPMPETTPNLMMYGSPGPTEYRGSITTIGAGGGRSYGDGRGPKYPSPIDEVPEYPMPTAPQMPMPRRSTFYDPFMGNGGYGRI
jgi:hypothetical protein